MHSIRSYSPLSSISINSLFQLPEKRADFPGNIKVWFLSFVHALFLVESDLLSLLEQTPRRYDVCLSSVCMYGIPSITFNSIQSINHRQLRPCRWQLVCLTSSDNLMIPSHSGPFFSFFFIFFPFRQNSSPFYANCRTTQKGQNWFIQNAPCNT